MNRVINETRHIKANFYWIDFVMNNSDILAALNKSPLSLERTDVNNYQGSIFGIKLKVERASHERSGIKGFAKSFAKLTLPCFLGSTYTTVTNTYYAVDEQITSFELNAEVELYGLSALYLKFCKKSIDKYLDRICSDVENAARMLASDDSRLDELLNDSQKIRVADYRKNIENIRPLASSISPSLEASISVSIVKDIILVEADAVMPDKHFLTAKNEIPKEKCCLSEIQKAAGILAGINNPVFTVRGISYDSNENSNIEFHQAAFEFGHKLYQYYFYDNLREIMPVLLHHGKETLLRFDVAGHLESLPWEALHDGKDFIATKLRFSRTLGAARYTLTKNTNDITKFRILLIGSDSRGDLPGTKIEVEAIQKLLGEIGVKNIQLLYGAQANRKEVLDAILSGEFNVLHFSGHSVFNPDAPHQSYLELAQGTKLSLHELDSLNDPDTGKNLLNLVFLNSCQSGYIGTDQITGKNLSMCRILRESGVDNVIGMLWNISDEAATQVASVFYKALVTGQSQDVAEAMRRMRCKVAMDRAWQDGSWLAPVLYS